MSAERFQIDMDELGCWARQSNETWACVMHFTKDSDILQVRIAEKVIRQQARDIELLTQMLHDQRLVIDDLEHRRVKVCDENDQLRADLAAAVAERGRLTRSIEDDFSGWRAVERRWKARAEQAEARLAAIDAAQTVAVIGDPDYPYIHRVVKREELPPIGTELIARPAKD